MSSTGTTRHLIIVQCCHLAQFVYLARRIRQRHPFAVVSALADKRESIPLLRKRLPFLREIRTLKEQGTATEFAEFVFPLVNRGYWKLKSLALKRGVQPLEVNPDGTLRRLSKRRLIPSFLFPLKDLPTSFHSFAQGLLPEPPRSRILLVESASRERIEGTRKVWAPILEDSTEVVRINNGSRSFWRQIRGEPFGAVIIFFSTESGYLRLKLLGFLARSRLRIGIDKKGRAVQFTVRTLLRFAYERLLRRSDTREATRILLLQTEGPKYIKKAVSVLEGGKIGKVTVRCYGEKDELESISCPDDHVKVLPRMSRLKLLRLVLRGNFDMVAAVFSGRPVFFLNKLFFLFCPLRKKVVLNANLDFVFLNWRTFLSVFCRAVEPEKPRVLLLGTEEPDLVRQAAGKLKESGLFPRSELRLMGRWKDDFDRSGLSIEQVHRAGPGLRGWIVCLRALVSFSPRVTAAVYAGRRTHRFLKLVHLLYPARRLFVNSNLDCEFLSGREMIAFLKAASPKKMRVLMIQSAGARQTSEGLRRLRDASKFPDAELLLLCRSSDAPRLCSENRVDRVFTSTGSIPDTWRAWRKARASGVDVTCALFTGSSGFLFPKLLNLLGRPLRRMAFNRQMECCEVRLALFKRFFRKPLTGELEREAAVREVPQERIEKERERLIGIKSSRLAQMLSYDLVYEFTSWRKSAGNAQALLKIKTTVWAILAELESRDVEVQVPEILLTLFSKQEKTRIWEIETSGKLRFLPGNEILFGEERTRLTQVQFTLLRALALAAPRPMSVTALGRISGMNGSGLNRLLLELSEILAVSRAADLLPSIEGNPQQGFRLNLPTKMIPKKDFVGSLLCAGEDRGWALDLGSGNGSFDYESNQPRLLAADLCVPGNRKAGAKWLEADAKALPLPAASIGSIICNNALEHFPQLGVCLQEIDRVIDEDGCLWVTVPDSSSLDDRLYRFLYEGGGHVNLFTLKTLVSRIEQCTGLRAILYKRLNTGFTYLTPPRGEEFQHYPRRARTLFRVLPPFLLASCQRWMSWLAVEFDRIFGTDWSLYGWGVLFRRLNTTSRPFRFSEFSELMPDEIVCHCCGRGYSQALLETTWPKGWVLGRFACYSCGTRMLFPRYARTNEIFTSEPQSVSPSFSRRVSAILSGSRAAVPGADARADPRA